MANTVVRPGLDGMIRTLWTYPFTPPSLNVWQQAHWGRKTKIKELWRRASWAFMTQSGLPKDCEWVFASAELIFRVGAHRDLTNYSATLWKIWPDVLQQLGVLRDDTENEMRTGTVKLIVDKKLRGQIQSPRQQGITRIAIVAKPRDVLFDREGL